MKKNIVDHKNNHKKMFWLLPVMYILWFLPVIPSLSDSWVDDKKLTALVIILSLFITTIFYYLCKNNILRLIAMLSAIAVITAVIGYKYMLTVFAAFVVIYVYKSSIAEKGKNESLSKFLLLLVPYISIVGIIINRESIIIFRGPLIKSVIIFVISFLILINSANKKGNEKKTKGLYRNMFYISILGIIASIPARDYTFNSIVIFPWFFFISILIYEEDEILYFSSEMIVNKIKAFLK